MDLLEYIKKYDFEKNNNLDILIEELFITLYCRKCFRNNIIYCTINSSIYPFDKLADTVQLKDLKHIIKKVSLFYIKRIIK